MPYADIHQSPTMGQSALATAFAVLKRAIHRIASALSVREEFYSLELAIPETRTVAVAADVGWRQRPTAVVACPGCATELQQVHPLDAVDCPACWTVHEPERFDDLEVVGLTCPRCGDEMEYGTRHPDAIDAPQWASCPGCQYHWEYAHGYRAPS